jgi:hypothetical protein
MAKSLVLMALLGALLFCAPAVAEVTTNLSLPLNMMTHVPCANGGNGEIVQLSGELHLLTTLTINDNTIHVSQHAQPKGVSGIGMVTGDKYQATGVTRSDTNGAVVTTFPYNTTYINNFRVIGPGPGNNYLVHATIHTTIDANGRITAQVTNTSSECK